MMKRVEGEHKRRGTKQGRPGRIQVYAAAALVFAALVSAAFFLPQLAFAMQDEHLYQDYVFGKQDSLNTSLLAKAYERSLYQRILHYSQLEQSGAQIYVTEQEMTPDGKLYDFLNSESGLWSNSVMLWMELSYPLYNALYDYQVTMWKQYVIYSDQYAEGVNFIIWYVETEHETGMKLRVLLDAETGDFYGMQCDYSALESVTMEKAVMPTVLDYLRINSKNGMVDVWMSVADLCSGLGETDEFNDAVREYYESVGMEGGNQEMAEAYGTSNGMVADKDSETAFQRLLMQAGTGWSVSDNRLDLYYPYGDYSQIFRVYCSGNFFFLEEYSAIAANITVGFPAIYERVPEFMEHLDEEE